MSEDLPGTTNLASAIVLVRAVNFGANPETLASNAFQAAHSEVNVVALALAEQDALAVALEAAGVHVLRLEPPAASRSPDAVFPNNWFSTHADGRLVIYPMEAPSRRSERMHDLAARLGGHGYHARVTVDLAAHAESGRFLEGTGSLVLDRAGRIAYACASSRTHAGLAAQWAQDFGYQLCLFDAAGPDRRAVYHTNVIMSLGAGLAIVCLDAVAARDRERLRASLAAGGQEILPIDWEQVRAFAGNQLFLQGRDGPLAVLSKTADEALRAEQKAVIDRHARRLVADVATIERHGGGSVRCMLAEIFLPRRAHSY